MLKRLVQGGFIILGGTLGVFLLPDLFLYLHFDHPFINNPYVAALVGALLFYLLTFWAVDYIVEFIKWIEDRIVNAPLTDIVTGGLGLLAGLLVAMLVGIPLAQLELPIVNTVVPILLTIGLGYLGFQFGFKRRDELTSLFSSSKSSKRKEVQAEETAPALPAKSFKILDTSVIIDGRIADICETGFLDGTIVIPQFVLEELQHIADSSDTLKRTKGRRGLDILNRLQKDVPIEVEMTEKDYEDVQEVDSKLVKLAKEISGIVVTNDFNLNKVCEFQKVQVLNINDLANAVKPVVIPGEEMHVLVIKDGKEQRQGVAYLDDGTMIVVEDGRDFIGKQIDVIVTSVLQTSAGRMIFAKPKHA
ncbi:PIN/TRAM domain-containing protein [Domibacillus sp. PGB-M46]|uniref:PIN/TRAM domain-containing protein n=1 Tax=Domibacillus sp. PGB-M46 TaxID=2910255 RepID=UPI001F5928F3|nr:PIN/TRAM domain-containing protein [Domibacillus sp. PGB-M46]MCI2256779.1 PIN/TRAM domain-containing protein [Domibacillus sp. PGB-M46]